MFELAKKEFLNENGTLNGDTTKRESVYNNYIEKWIKMTVYQQAGQWNNMNINIDRHLQKQQKPLIIHGKLVNQYRRVHWMALRESMLRVERSQ